MTKLTRYLAALLCLTCWITLPSYAENPDATIETDSGISDVNNNDSLNVDNSVTHDNQAVLNNTQPKTTQQGAIAASPDDSQYVAPADSN